MLKQEFADRLRGEVEEEEKAGRVYDELAGIASDLGLSVLVTGLRKISNDEFRHKEELKDMIRIIETVTRRWRMGGPMERLTPPGAFLETSGVIVTVTNAGDTGLTVGATVSAEEFDRRNASMTALGKRRALGEYHY